MKYEKGSLVLYKGVIAKVVDSAGKCPGCNDEILILRALRDDRRGCLAHSRNCTPYDEQEGLNDELAFNESVEKSKEYDEIIDMLVQMGKNKMPYPKIYEN